MNTEQLSDVLDAAADGPVIVPDPLAQVRQSLPENVRQSIPLNISRAMGTFTQTLNGEGPAAEILPGYTIEKSIGAGGFGEVFLCDAPGGIKKAVKVVFGTMDDERAERELKSMMRIKDVRHPFLVGVERIEVVNQQLVIVTELADRSLKQRFLECKMDQRLGIPRDELLSYLKDAAEALDYLYEKHTLQHLDVKPENLLLLGDHLKVADFGLLKDLRDTQMSLVGGVTPLYAPPEVLDGRPNRHSDQYSLAIVYQEMLTGELPFNGRTAGQLAAQHMHSQPVLAPLPTSDRYAVGRALSKSPARRFESCREFIDALVNPPKRAFVKQTETAPADTEFGEAEEFARTSNSPLMRAETQQTRALPPLDSLVDGTGPAVVIGVGGLGGRVVTAIKEQLTSRFGDAHVPAVQLLYIDTEREAISQAARREDAAALRSDELLAVPLRAASEYRERKKALLSWMSRRWLYNIPRSMKTEGIRPLGRLAMVDHAATIKARIESAIDTAAAPEHARQSTTNTGVAFAERAPRVFVVGAATGGTGSGMLLDLGYYAQYVLSQRKLEGTVNGLVLHGSGRRAEQRDLGDVNAVSFFGELYHFSRDHERYPGDGTFPAAPTGVAPFTHTYTVDLGTELSDDEFTAQASRVATYVTSNLLGASASFFNLVRQKADVGESTVRSFGIGILGGQRLASMPAPDVLCDAVIARWTEKCRGDMAFGGEMTPDVTSSPAIDQAAAETLARLHLNATQPADLTVELETRLDRCKGNVTHAWIQAASRDGLTRADVALEHLEAALSAPREAGGLCAELQAHVSNTATARREERLKVIRETIFTPPVEGVPGLEDALGMMFAVVRELVDAQQACDARAKQRRAEVDTLRRQGPPSGGNWGNKCPAAISDYLVEYCRLRLSEVAETARAAELQALLAETVGTSQLFDRVRTALEAARNDFSRVADGHTDLSDALLDSFERRVRDDVLSRVGPFWPMVVTDPKHRGSFVRAMRQAATEAVSEQCLSVATDASTADGSDDPVRDAKPMWPTNPGAVRWLISGPSPETVRPLAERIQRQFGVSPTYVPGGDGRITMTCEAENIPLANVTREIVGQRLDHLETATRVRTRSDIDWTA